MPPPQAHSTFEKNSLTQQFLWFKNAEIGLFWTFVPPLLQASWDDPLNIVKRVDNCKTYFDLRQFAGQHLTHTDLFQYLYIDDIYVFQGMLGLPSLEEASTRWGKFIY